LPDLESGSAVRSFARIRITMSPVFLSNFNMVVPFSFVFVDRTARSTATTIADRPGLSTKKIQLVRNKAQVSAHMHQTPTHGMASGVN
jgi:hypothetical protein